MRFLEKHGGRIGPALAILLAAIGQAWIGGGTFGPDAAGAQAAAVLLNVFSPNVTDASPLTRSVLAL